MEKGQKGKKNKFMSLIVASRVPKATLTFGLIGLIFSTMVSLMIPLLTREIVDGFSMESFSVAMIIVIAAAFILQALMEGVSTYLLGAAGQKVVANMREMIWLKLIRLPVRYFNKTASGESVSRVVNDTGIVKELISDHFPNFISGIISIIGAVIILFILDWRMTLLMLIAIPITVLLMIPLGKRMAKVSRGLQDEIASFSGSIQQTISEIRLMKSSTAEETEEDKGKKGIGKIFRFGLKEVRINAVIGPLIYLIVMVVMVGIIGYGGVRVAEGTLSTGSLVAFLLYLFQITFPVTSFAMFFTQLQKAKGATERIMDILHTPLEAGQTGVEKDISNEAVHVRNLSFAYENERVLEDISFDVYPGEMIAFAGPSGGGKSTLFGLLERYHEPDNGEINIGKTSIHDLSLASWRSQIGYVSQEAAMTAGTLRENLCYGLPNKSEVTDEQIWEVCKMAYADAFIREFPDGLDTVVGERGVRLSGGQKQRMNIARAFLRDPKILMLDEATASLDSQSERIVQKALEQLMADRTTFVIAHRLSTIVNADKIVFIEKGKMTGIGTHQELMQNHALYREFAEQQLT